MMERGRSFHIWIRSAVQRQPFVIIVGLQMSLIIILFHFPYYTERLTHTDVSYLDSTAIYQAVAIADAQEKAKSVMVDAKVLSISSTDSMKREFSKTHGKVKIYLEKDSAAMAVRACDELLLRMCPQHGTTLYDRSGQFDYGDYLQKQGFVGYAYADSLSWLKIGHQTSHTPRAVADRCQRRLRERLHSASLRPQNEAVIEALLLGYREDLNGDTKQAFSVAGAMHVLAVSGLHVGIIYGLLIGLLTLFGRRKPLYRSKRKIANSIVIIVALWCYAFLTGLSPSVVRATLMFSLGEICRVTERQQHVWNVIAASAFLSLCFNPAALFSVSFQLSYSAVIGIVLIGNWLQTPLTQPLWGIKANIKMRWLRKLYGVFDWLCRYFLSIIAMSLAAQLFTLPLTLYYFHQTSNYFMLTNLIVIPCANLILSSSIILLLFVNIPVLGGWIKCITDCFTTIMNYSVGAIERLPMSSTHIDMSVSEVIIYYLCITVVVYGIRRGEFRFLVPLTLLLLSVSVQRIYIQEEKRNTDMLLIDNEIRHISYNIDDTICSVGRDIDTLLIFNYHDRRYVYLSGDRLHNNPTESPKKIDYLILGAQRKTKAEEVLQFFTPDTVIMTRAFPIYRRQEWRDSFDSTRCLSGKYLRVSIK